MGVPEATAGIEVARAHAARLLENDPALAAEQAREILQVAERDPGALLVLGVALRRLGQPRGAVATLGTLVREHPRFALAQLEFGLALGAAGQGDEAVAALRRALELKPTLPQGWLALAGHLAATGDDAGAARAHAEHLRHSLRDPGLLRAADALAGHRVPEAERLLRAHLAKAPGDPVALRMLAEVAARLGRNEDAERLLAHCVELAPAFHAARHQYALLLHRANKPVEALEQLDVLLRAEPDDPGHRNLKAVVLCRIGDFANAIDLYARLLEEYPAQPRIWLSQGHALKTAGHTDRAIAAYREALRRAPGFGEAWWSLANLKTFRFDEGDVAAMQAQLARPDLPAADRFHLDFALGKAHEDRRAWERAFVHYRDGNALRRTGAPYDADDTTARLAHARRLYTREFFEERRGWGAQAPDPIFIVGLPRAGSTLVEQILSSHPLVEGTTELPEIITLTRQLRALAAGGGPAPYHDALAALDADAVRALGERYLERTRIHRHGGAPRFVDKMPNNFAHVALIHLALPNATIIDARRHPMACCFSAFKQHFARGQGFSYDLADLGRYYRDYVELIAHFDDVLPGRVHRVIHERLVEDTEAEVRRLLAHCGLPFDPACLRFFENDRPVRTASSEQVRRPINRDGFDQWRHFEAWLGPLKEALGPVLDAYPDVPAAPAGHGH